MTRCARTTLRVPAALPVPGEVELKMRSKYIQFDIPKILYRIKMIYIYMHILDRLTIHEIYIIYYDQLSC